MAESRESPLWGRQHDTLEPAEPDLNGTHSTGVWEHAKGGELLPEPGDIGPVGLKVLALVEFAADGFVLTGVIGDNEALNRAEP